MKKVSEEEVLFTAFMVNCKYINKTKSVENQD